MTVTAVVAPINFDTNFINKNLDQLSQKKSLLVKIAAAALAIGSIIYLADRKTFLAANSTVTPTTQPIIIPSVSESNAVRCAELYNDTLKNKEIIYKSLGIYAQSSSEDYTPSSPEMRNALNDIKAIQRENDALGGCSGVASEIQLINLAFMNNLGNQEAPNVMAAEGSISNGADLKA